MKLQMQTPHESRMCPIDFEVKRSKVKVTMHKLLKNCPCGGISPVRTDPDLVCILVGKTNQHEKLNQDSKIFLHSLTIF